MNSSLLISGTGYYRYIRADTYNPNLNTESYGESLYNLSAADIAALTAAGYQGFPTTGNPSTMPFPFWRCLAQALALSEPIEKCNAVIARTWNHQHNYGLSGQVSWRAGRNRLTAGTAWDHSTLDFQQLTQFGYLNPDRVTITPVPAFEDGSTTSNNVPVDTRVNLSGTVNTP